MNEIPPEVLENREELSQWAQRSLDIQEKKKNSKRDSYKRNAPTA